jgi:hydrogenase expression/formation protein HypC
MCLAVPARILKIKNNRAVVDSLGVKKEVDVTLVPDAVKGDYVIVHAGFAIQIVEEKEALGTQDYWREWLNGQKD